MNAIGYIRVSTERQASEDRTSLSDQREAIEALARKIGVTVSSWCEDAGISGATAEKRPGFQALLESCAQNPQPKRAPGFVLVLNASRFGRFEDSEDAAYWRVHLRKRGWEVRFAEGDAEGDAGPIVRAVQSMEASAYRRNLIANTRRGMKSSANLGLWTREAPFGYRRQVVGGRILEKGVLKAPNERVRLTPHEEEARVVRWIYERYASGEHSLSSLADLLHETSSGKRWGVTVLNHILRNDAYRGAVIGGRRRDGSTDVYGVENAHPPIVPSALWQAAQVRLDQNHGRGRAVRSPYILSGLLRCATCGEAYTGGGGPRNPLRKFYKDNGGISGVCPGRIGTVLRHIVEDGAIGILTETFADRRIRTKIVRAIDRVLESAPASESEATIRSARGKLEQKRERLVGAVGDGTLLPTEAAVQLSQLRQAIEDHDHRIHTLRFTKARDEGSRGRRDQMIATLDGFGAAAARLDGPMLRELIEPWIGHATFNKRDRTLTIGILPVPSLSIHSTSRGARTEQKQGLIVRSTSLRSRSA